MAERVFFGTLATGGGVRPGSGAFRVLLVGDFSGRGPRAVQEPLAGRKALPLDVDNWESVLAGLPSEAVIPLGSGDSSIVFRPEQLEGFHPDVLFGRLAVFRALRSLRARLQDPATFEAAAGEIRAWVEAPVELRPPPAPAAPAGGGEDDGQTLRRLLGEAPPDAAARPAPPRGGMDALLREIVAPYIVPDTTLERTALLGRLDDIIAGQMRAILHYGTFRQLEAAWRSVHFLVTHLETGEQLELHLLDATKPELIADLMAADDLRSTALFRLLVTEAVGTQGGRPWSLVALAETFDKTILDAALLGRLAKLARAAGAPVVAGAHERVAGCASLPECPDPAGWSYQVPPDAQAAWDALRRLPEARWVALGLPRMLLRLPYGRDTDPVESFDFEEVADGWGHASYLWGEPAFALAEVLASAFLEHRWSMAAELYRDIEDLPLHVYTAEEGRRVMPCAEVYLSDRAADVLQAQGLTALLSVQGSNRIRVRGIPALAEPVAALAGRWGR